MRIWVDHSAWDRQSFPNPHALAIYLNFVHTRGVALERFKECQCEDNDVHFHCQTWVFPMMTIIIGYEAQLTPFPWSIKLNTWLTLLQPHFGLSEGEAHTPKSGNLESSGTLENSELELKGQNTSHWRVLGVIEKFLKCRCLNWPRIGHLDICSPSYGQKKGRESN
jgi:hypothetical protein